MRSILILWYKGRMPGGFPKEIIKNNIKYISIENFDWTGNRKGFLKMFEDNGTKETNFILPSLCGLKYSSKNGTGMTMIPINDLLGELL